jgi:hypothetical protein
MLQLLWHVLPQPARTAGWVACMVGYIAHEVSGSYECCSATGVCVKDTANQRWTSSLKHTVQVKDSVSSPYQVTDKKLGRPCALPDNEVCQTAVKCCFMENLQQTQASD